MEKVPEMFCEFQREYLPGFGVFVCGICDWQNSRPHCNYKSALELASKNGGCDIANVEGQRIKSFLGDPNANPPEFAKDFEIRFRDGPLNLIIASESEVNPKKSQYLPKTL
jgi:hypothetical protein